MEGRMAEIKLSKDETTTYDVQRGDKIEKETKPLRELETALLKSVFSAAFTIEKELKKSILARDLYEQIENLTDKDEKITLTTEDLGIFKTGWEAFEKQRPSLWMKCGALLKQLV
jgi:hypothetical protein